MLEWVIIFLCGDVMTGRGIDQALPYSVDPELHERYVQSAGDYVRLAERANGRMRLPLTFDYIWGDALDVWEKKDPALRIINLETSITNSANYDRRKGIHYRMHPGNVEILDKAEIDFCSLANNHTLDWGIAGLEETLDTFRAAQINFGGAGTNAVEAWKSVVLPIKEGKHARIYAVGGTDCGIPGSWAATPDRAGLSLLNDLSRSTASDLANHINTTSSDDELVILSIHWGDNWGYEIPDQQIEFAHQLIDESRVDLIHGHSSHHIRPFELYKGKLILYGCGDFITDYEGIAGHEEYRGDLSVMFFPKLDLETGDLLSLQLVPMQMRRFKLNHASRRDSQWLCDTINRICRPFQLRVTLNSDHTLVLQIPEE